MNPTPIGLASYKKWTEDREGHTGSMPCDNGGRDWSDPPRVKRGIIPWFGTFHLQNHKKMNSYCFKPSSLWYLIIAELEI